MRINHIKNDPLKLYFLAENAKNYTPSVYTV